MKDILDSVKSFSTGVMDIHNFEVNSGMKKIRLMWFSGVLVSSVIFFGVNAFFGQFPSQVVESGNNLTFFSVLEKADTRIWLLLVSAVLPTNIYILLYYAPLVLPDLNHLGNVFSHNRPFQDLCKAYRDWLKWPSAQKKNNSSLAKKVYMALWLIYVASFPAYAFKRLPNALPICGSFIFLVIIGITNIILNFFVYFNCVCYTYFLRKVYYLAQEDALSYIEEYPSITYGFQMLDRTVRRIYICFFLDSLLSTIAHVSFLGIVFPGDALSFGWNCKFLSFVYINGFMIIFGFTSWIGIMLLSRVYLRRIHDIWKMQRLQKLQERYDNEMDSQIKENVVSEMNTIVHDSLSVGLLERIMSITTLIANLATAGITFDMFRKLLEL